MRMTDCKRVSCPLDPVPQYRVHHGGMSAQPSLDLDSLFEQQITQLHEVPGLMEKDFPIGVAWLVAVARADL